MSIKFEHSGHMSREAIKVCEEIEWNASSTAEAWEIAIKSDFYKEIAENAFFIED